MKTVKNSIILSLTMLIAFTISGCKNKRDNKEVKICHLIKKNDGACSNNKQCYSIPLPYLEKAAIIDGNLDEWKDYAFHDGVWDIYRLQYCCWYEPERNRQTMHGKEPSPEKDLSARYYMAWDNKYIYLGAEVHDNVNDVAEEKHEPKRWYYKDCIAWFIEAPHDTISEMFGQGDNAFCFVIDIKRPDYGAWWRHGATDTTYLEEPIPAKSVEYTIKMNPWNNNPADYILEAKVDMAATFGKSDPNWHTPKIDDVYSVEIVHTDPDGGNYGGHFLIYGTGDDDATWGKMILTGPKKPIERKEK